MVNWKTRKNDIIKSSSSNIQAETFSDPGLIILRSSLLSQGDLK